MEDLNKVFTSYKEAVSDKAAAEAMSESLKDDISRLTSELQNNISSIKRLNTNIALLEDKLSSVLSLKKTLKEQEQVKPKIKEIPLFDSDFDPRWVYSKKATHILKAYNRCVTVREIVEAIKKLENREEDTGADRALNSSVSSALSSNTVKEKLFGRYKEYEADDWKYGLIEWFDGVNVIDEYRYRKY